MNTQPDASDALPCVVCQRSQCQDPTHIRNDKPMGRLDEIAVLTFLIVLGASLVALFLLIAL